MNTDRFARACCWPMNSPSRCGRSEVSATSSSRRSGVTKRRGDELNANSSKVCVVVTSGETRSALLNDALQIALAPILVGQQLADRRYSRSLLAGNDDAGVAIIVPDQLPTASAGRDHGDLPVGFGRLRV